MKRLIPAAAGLVVGLILGYFAGSLAAAGAIMVHEPRLFSSFAFAGYRSTVICDCENRPAQQARESLLGYWGIVQKHRDAKPPSPSNSILALESALTDVRLSVVDQKLGNAAEAGDYMKRAQQELSALGWSNVSAGYLQNVVYRWDTQYRAPNPNKNTAQTIQPANVVSKP
jgi:hypothetical protein